MARKEVRIFEIKSEDAEEVRTHLQCTFPGFLAKCISDKATYRLKYSEIANARFYYKYGFGIKEFIFMAFFHNPNKKKHNRRRLSVTKKSDT